MVNWMSALLDGYIQLAHAIVIVAAESYKYTLLAVRHHTKSDSVYRRKEELESFSVGVVRAVVRTGRKIFHEKNAGGLLF